MLRRSGWQVHAEDRGSPLGSGSRQSEGGASHAGQGQVGSVKGALFILSSFCKYYKGFDNMTETYDFNSF